MLVGFPEAIHAELNRHGDWAGLPIQVAEAPETIQMSEAPLAALRRKPRASVRVAANLAASGQANALFSAGHTGATLLSAHGAFGVLDGVERPALAVTVPTRTGAALLLDAGANMDCRPEHLAQFAVMGAAYARVALQIERPKVALLSIGEEAGKGSPLVQTAWNALKASKTVRFIGNVEGQQIFSGDADVIVCDGFTGNVILKAAEGMSEAFLNMLLDEFAKHATGKNANEAAQQVLADFKSRTDYAAFGGAPLLGHEGAVFISHGRSRARAMKNAVLAAGNYVDHHVNARITEALAKLAAEPEVAAALAGDA